VLARLRALASESIIYGLSGIVSRFISLFLVPIYTRLFSPEDYGVMSLVGSSIAVVSIFVVLGLDNSAHRWFWDTEDETDRHRTLASWAWCQLGVSAVFGVVVYLFADRLGHAIVGRPDAGTYFRIAAVTLPLSVLGGVLSNWFRMQRRPWATTFYALGTTLLTVGLTLLFVVGWRWGLTGVYLAQAIALAVGSVVAAVLLRGWIAPRYVNAARLRVMLRYALPLIPAGLAYWVVGFADRYFVQAYTNTAEVGLYSIGSSLAAGLALVTGAFQQAWGPFALSIHQAPDARRTYATVFLFYLWVTGALSAGLSLFAPEIIRVFATAQYAGASVVVGVLAASYVMIGLTYIAATGPAIARRTGPTGIAMVSAAVLNIILNFALVPTYGKVGSAVATLIAQSVTPIYLFRRSQQLYPIPYRFGAGVILFAITLLVMAVGLQVNTSTIWLGVLLKAGLLSLFVPVFFFLKLAPPGQLRALLARLFSRVRSVPA
jgi:O-antigen/teichoic acid export membrane protein